MNAAATGFAVIATEGADTDTVAAVTPSPVTVAATSAAVARRRSSAGSTLSLGKWCVMTAALMTWSDYRYCGSTPSAAARSILAQACAAQPVIAM